ncbi:hypothetical protein JTB14_005593 [Gonioctena quinquepunctata]|nr:hypothetical protein JTB14_005593 [Gonioctena quinquepunctata]
MPQCFVPGCSNTYRSTICVLVSYHRFPKKYQQEWLEAIGRDTSLFISNEVVCSDHFNKKDFEKGGQRKLLKQGVIPTRNIYRRPIEFDPPINSSNTDIREDKEPAGFPKFPKRRFTYVLSSESSFPHVKKREIPKSASSAANPFLERRLVEKFHNYCQQPNELKLNEIILKQKNRVLTNRIRFLTKKLKKTQELNERRKRKIKTLFRIILEQNKALSL